MVKFRHLDLLKQISLRRSTLQFWLISYIFAVASLLPSPVSGAEQLMLVANPGPAEILGPSELSEWNKLRTLLEDDQSLTLDQQKRLFGLTQKAVLMHEKQARFKAGLPHPWPWGLYYLTFYAFNYGTTLFDGQQEKLALEVLEEGLRASQLCLDSPLKDPSFHLAPCHFARASHTAKIASIKGLFASISKARSAQDEWLSVADGNVDMLLTRLHTLKASANHALGLYFRLVPDMWLVQFIFHVRGSLDESIRRHQLASSVHPQNACFLFGESTALLCRGQKRSSSVDTQSGRVIAAKVIQMSVAAPLLVACQDSVRRIFQKQELACGYTGAKQVSDEDAKSIVK